MSICSQSERFQIRDDFYFLFSLQKYTKMRTTVFLTCADDGLGRFDRSTLSQQSLMELFIFGMDRVEDILASPDDPREVCMWKGVTCNADE